MLFKNLDWDNDLRILLSRKFVYYCRIELLD